MFFHRFEQGALRFRRRAIHFVGEYELRKDRSLVELKAAVFPIENRDADDIRGQQVARKLDALVRQAQRFGEGMRQRRLADAGNVFDQEMPASEQAGNTEPQLMLFAEDDAVELCDRRADEFDRVSLGDQSRNR